MTEERAFSVGGKARAIALWDNTRVGGGGGKMWISGTPFDQEGPLPG